MKQRAVIYAPGTRDDLDWIYHTIAGSGGPHAAERYEQRIRAFCERLDTASERGTRRDDLRSGLRVVGFERRVSVAFTVDDTQVTILRIFYGGADWEHDL